MRKALATVLLAAAGLAQAQNAAVTITVDANANRRAIKPEIYGLAHASAATLADLNVPLNRSGGNPTSRYNWQANADNRGFDWYFESLPYSSAVAGEGGDSFVTNARAGGAQPMLTVPLIGWVAKLGPNRGRLASFSVAKYGAQQGRDAQWFPDAGNGVRTNGAPVTGNDPNDASVAVDAAFQQGWVQHLVARWGTAVQGGVRYYLLDNEPSIWHSTHRDVHPTGATMDEMRQKIVDHATRIRATDPGARIVGPEEWGWSGYFWSGFDQQAGSQNGWSRFPDREAHGNAPYLPWLLDQLRAQHQATGTRLLDVFSVHYYPQGGEFGNDTSTAMQLRRNRSTRSLWDPAYTDETWIADKVRLIPRLREWVDAHYPGTAIAITEYNWGAESHINGATALGDVLGIFGREGLDLGAYWTAPDPSTPAYKAFKLYRNYDGQKAGFGETSVAAAGANPDHVAAFAALRAADGALTVMVINKDLSGNTPVRVALQGFAAGAKAQAWQLTATNAITRVADLDIAAGHVDATVPPQSLTLLVIPAAPMDPLGDADGDGVPNGVEPGEGLDAHVKDNDVFASARLFAMQQYRDFLGREGDAAGIVNWTAQLAGGAMTRAAMVEGFFNSAEFQNGLPQVTRLYFSFYGRIPDYPGLAFHTQRYRAGIPLATIAQDFAGSQEFLATYGALDNGQYVDRVYQNVLGRAPDAQGRATWLAQLDGGAMTRGQVMVGFSESAEFRALIDPEVFITAVYVGLLRRSPDAAGAANWVNAMGTGLSRVQALQAFMASMEYHNRFLP